MRANYLNYLLATVLVSCFFHVKSQCDGFDPNQPIQHTTSYWDWRIDDVNNWIAYVPHGAGLQPVPLLSWAFSPLKQTLNL